MGGGITSIWGNLGILRDRAYNPFRFRRLVAVDRKGSDWRIRPKGTVGPQIACPEDREAQPRRCSSARVTLLSERAIQFQIGVLNPITPRA